MVKVRELIRHKNPDFIPSYWEFVELGEIGNLLSGLTYSPDNIDEQGTLVLRSSNINNGYLEFDDNVFVDTTSLKFYPVEEGDILICVRNGSKSLIGKNALITEKAEGMAFGAFMALFRSEHNQFLTHLFNTDLYKSQIHRNLGATINSINGSDFKKFHFPFPPSEERKKIAEILSTWDKAISTSQKLADELKLRNKGLAQQLLTGKKRLNGFDEEWEDIPLGKCAKNVNIRNKEKHGTENLYAVTKKSGIIPMREQVKGGNFNNCKIVRQNWFAYNPMRINIGSIALWEKPEEIMVSGDYVVFECDKNKLIPHYLEYLRKTVKWENHMLIAGNGSVRIRIYFKDLAHFTFPLPHVNEQKAILKVLDGANKELKLFQQQIDTLKEQKKGLMQKLLTGEIRVNIK